jgi:hypothetical protein
MEAYEGYGTFKKIKPDPECKEALRALKKSLIY